MNNEQISKFLQERIDAGDFPSAVYIVAEKGEIVFGDALGYAVVEPERIAAKIDTIYDLASLTKPLVTGLIVTLLSEQGNVILEKRVGEYLIEFDNADKREITVRDLMLHTSGLTAWQPFYLNTDNRAEILPFIGELKRERPEGDSVVYSDLNFTVLMFLIERLTGVRIDEAANNLILRPLKLTETRFSPPAALRPRIAASEKGNEYERNTCVELGYAQAARSDRFRDHQIWGEVHDGNAWFMGGVAGHAGLFSTAKEVYKIALQFLPNYTTLLKPQTCELFRANFTLGLDEARSIAFQLAETPESTAGSRMSPQSFGHLGFTGTSLWIDPKNERIFILLTNRTHAHPLPFVNINSVRRRFHDLANEALDENN